MKVKIIFAVLISIVMNIHAQNEDRFNINDIKYNINLIKFYIDRAEFDTALEYIDKTLEEAVHKDLLYYYKGFIYKQKENWQQSSKFFAKSILDTADEVLVSKRLAEFKLTIVQVSPLSAFDLVSYAVSEAQTSQKQIGFLHILATLYESNQLYSEANDVYQTILQEIDDTNESELKLKIAANKIFQKEFQSALNILEPLIEQNDSLLIENLLFLNYIANISTDNYEDAKKSLIKLYLDFPNNANREEIIAGLSEIYEIQGQYLMSWYMLNELFKTSSKARKYKISNDIERIKRMICDKLTTKDLFKYLKPIFEIEYNEQKADDLE